MAQPGHSIDFNATCPCQCKFSTWRSNAPKTLQNPIEYCILLQSRIFEAAAFPERLEVGRDIMPLQPLLKYENRWDALRT
jgi:hypothetical protein